MKRNSLSWNEEIIQKEHISILSGIGVGIKLIYMVCAVALTIGAVRYMSAKTIEANWSSEWYMYNMQDVFYDQKDDGTKYTPVNVGPGSRGI